MLTRPSLGVCACSLSALQRQMSRDVRQDSVVADETDGAEATAAAEAAAAAQRQLSTASASASAGPSDPRVIQVSLPAQPPQSQPPTHKTSCCHQDAESRPSLLRALLIYDSEEIERQFRDGVYDCEVCFESKTGEDCVRFSACQHIFCRECISGYFASQVCPRWWWWWLVMSCNRGPLSSPVSSF